jgi:hypothetical protein
MQKKGKIGFVLLSTQHLLQLFSSLIVMYVNKLITWT